MLCGYMYLQEEEDDDDIASPKPLQKTPPALQNGVSPKQKKKLQPTAPESPAQKQKTPKANKQQSPNEKTPTVKSAKKEKQTPQQKTPKPEKPTKELTPSPKPQKRSLEGGVVVEDLKVGSGDLAKPGKMVQVLIYLAL